jgi:cell division protease FtsH
MPAKSRILAHPGVLVNDKIKTALFWIAIALSTVLLWTVIKSKSGSPPPEVSYADFLSQVEAGNVAKVKLSKTEVVGTRRDGTTFRANLPDSQEGMLQTLHQKNVEIWATKSDETTPTNWFFSLILPVCVLGGLWFFMIRRMTAARQGKGPPPTDTRPPNIG